MPSTSHSPIFPNTVVNCQAAIASATAETVTLITGDATYATVVDGPILAHKKGSATRNIRIELKNGSTTTVLANVDLDGEQYSTVNLLSSTYIAGINDADPRLVLAPSTNLQITSTDTETGIVDLTSLNTATTEHAA